MSLPEPDRTPLAAPPLLVMLCQVRYDRRDDLASGSTAGTLLKRVTQLGLGSMTQIHQQQLVLIAGPPTEQVVRENPSQPAGWQFTDESNTTTLNILTDQMTLETRVYLGWDNFIATWEGCLDALVAGSEPSVSTRLGLRYANRVTSNQARNVIDFRTKELVDPAFLGPVDGSPLSDHVTATEGRATLKFPDGTEALVQHGAVSNSLTPAFVLDIDCFQSTAAEFDKHSLLETAATLNKRALQIFQAVVRPSLRDEMRHGGKVS